MGRLTDDAGLLSNITEKEMTKETKKKEKCKKNKAKNNQTRKNEEQREITCRALKAWALENKAPHPGFKNLWHIYFVDSKGKNIEHNSSVQFNRKIDLLRLIKLTMWLHKHLLT